MRSTFKLNTLYVCSQSQFCVQGLRWNLSRGTNEVSSPLSPHVYPHNFMAYFSNIHCNIALHIYNSSCAVFQPKMCVNFVASSMCGMYPLCDHSNNINVQNSRRSQYFLFSINWSMPHLLPCPLNTIMQNFIPYLWLRAPLNHCITLAVAMSSIRSWLSLAWTSSRWPPGWTWSLFTTVSLSSRMSMFLECKDIITAGSRT